MPRALGSITRVAAFIYAWRPLSYFVSEVTCDIAAIKIAIPASPPRPGPERICCRAVTERAPFIDKAVGELDRHIDRPRLRVLNPIHCLLISLQKYPP